MSAFAKRNLRLYFRDKGAVFFSLLAVFITIGLYILFLGNVYTKDMKDSISAQRASASAQSGTNENVSGAPDTANVNTADDVSGAAEEIMDNWVMAGIAAEAGITISLGVLGVVIADRSRKITKDFFVSPMKHSAMTGGYVICAYVVCVLMTILTFVLAELYIRVNGGEFLAAGKIVRALGVILLTDFAATGMMAFFVSLFHSQNAYTTASTVIGTLVGFVMGIYLPIGMYPTPVRWIIKCFPISHGAVLLRKIMTEQAMERAFLGAPSEVSDSVREYFGITYQFGSYQAEEMTSIWILIATGVLFMGLACVNLSRKQK